MRILRSIRPCRWSAARDMSGVRRRRRTVLLDGPPPHRDTDDDAIDGEGNEATRAYPAHEPGDHDISHNERNDEADEQREPLLSAGGSGADGSFAMMRPKGFEEVVERGDDHGGDGEEKRKFQRGGAREANDLSGGNGGHRTRGAGEDG